MVVMQGARPWTHTCTWIVECDGRMPGAVVIEYGRISPSGIPIPQYGDILNMTIDGSQIVDASSYAFDFVCRTVSSNAQVYVYEVDVTWREPTALDGTHPGAIPFRDRPDLRPPEVWVEYETVPSVQYLGRNIQVLSGKTSTNEDFERPALTLGAITNANGEMIDPVHVERTTAVLCAKSYVSTYDIPIALNAIYETTINSDVFLGKLPYYVKYRRADTGYPEYYNGQRYYAMTVRVDFGIVPWYHTIPNEGSYYYSALLDDIVTSSDVEGRSIVGRFFPLTLNGTFSAAGPVMLDYIVHNPVPYAGLVQYFT